jgi:hypothetical protein
LYERRIVSPRRQVKGLESIRKLLVGHQGLFRFVQDVAHIDEGYRALRRIQRPRASFSLAGFQVTFIGRF